MRRMGGIPSRFSSVGGREIAKGVVSVNTGELLENANATGSNRGSPRCSGWVGFGGRRRGKQEGRKDLVQLSGERTRVVEQLPRVVDGRPGFAIIILGYLIGNGLGGNDKGGFDSRLPSVLQPKESVGSCRHKRR